MATNGMIQDSFWSCGPKPGAFYSCPGSTTAPKHEARKRTLYPSVTGTSVLGITFKGGVMIAADMLGSYGSLARYRDCSRVMKVNDTTVLGAGGDYADYQYIKSVIEQRVIDEECLDDGFTYTPATLFSWLTRVMYSRRSNFNPLWNSLVVAGLEDKKPFLGYIDKIGTAYEADTVATGYGAYIAQPLLREAQSKTPQMTQDQASQLLDRCLKVLYYRDARSLNKYQVAIVTKDGVEIKGPLSSDANWEIAHLVSGFE
ncbi:proteasome subunit beta type-4-like [Liolophura sinensis]|uniref:proteasome subunit beta type-4-like n=1 Tax=Liolophura sinensis TaxID=3198878 RepID=UPI003159204B